MKQPEKIKIENIISLSSNIVTEEVRQFKVACDEAEGGEVIATATVKLKNPYNYIRVRLKTMPLLTISDVYTDADSNIYVALDSTTLYGELSKSTHYSTPEEVACVGSSFKESDAAD